MKRLLFLLLTILFLTECKNEKIDPLIASIEGRWHIVAFEKEVNGQKVWVEDSTYNPGQILVRNDGAILYPDGLNICCLSNNYIINGVPRKIDYPQTNVQCYLSSCIDCKSLSINLIDDKLYIGFCGPNSARTKYERD